MIGGSWSIDPKTERWSLGWLLASTHRSGTPISEKGASGASQYSARWRRLSVCPPSTLTRSMSGKYHSLSSAVKEVLRGSRLDLGVSPPPAPRVVLPSGGMGIYQQVDRWTGRLEKKEIKEQLCSLEEGARKTSEN